MSHYSVGIILKTTDEDGSQIDIGDEVERVLRPFDESINVAPYRVGCYCVNSVASKHGRDTADRLAGTIQSLRESFHKTEAYLALPEADRNDPFAESEAMDKLWEEHTYVYKAVREYAEHNHPMYKKPVAECTDCHGTGLRVTTYNPSSQWDWYEIGGRWDGRLCVQEPVEFAIREYAKNVITTAELVKRWDTPEQFTFFALVDPEGFWHEKGKMGWWGMVSNEKDNATWEQQSIEAYRKYEQDHIVVMVDCHI